MSEDLLQQISGRFNLQEVFSELKNNPKIFRFYTQHIMKNSRTSCKAAWVINHATWKKDNRIAIRKINLILHNPHTIFRYVNYNKGTSN